MSLNLSEDEITQVHSFLIDLLKPIYEDNDESLTAMADYCVILIKTHSDDVDTLTEFARSQLFDFLAENTDNFVTQLMHGLLTRAYIKPNPNDTHQQQTSTSVLNRIQIRPPPTQPSLPTKPTTATTQRQVAPIQWNGGSQPQQQPLVHQNQNQPQIQNQNQNQSQSQSQNENSSIGNNNQSQQHRQIRVCFSFRDKGICNRSNCQYEHISSNLAHRLGTGPSAPSTTQTQPLGHNRQGTKPHKTLVVTSIPDEQCKRFVLESWFSRFGSIERIEVKAHECKAFVTFTTLDASKSAYESPLAVLDNRFISIAYYSPNNRYTQQPQQPQPQQQQILVPSPPIPSQLGYPPYAPFQYWYPPPPVHEPYYMDQEVHSDVLSESEAKDRVKKRELDLIKIAQMHNTVQNKIQSCMGDPAQDLLDMLKTLDKQALDIKINLIANPATAALVPQYVKEVRDATQKAVLDAELEALAKLRSKTGGGVPAAVHSDDDDGLDIDVGSEGPAMTKLQPNGPASVSVPNPVFSHFAWRPPTSTSTVPSAATPAFASFSKDFRPTSVLVNGLAHASQVPFVVQALTTKYGEIESHEFELTDAGDGAGSLFVKFKVRLSAERAVASGLVVDGFGTLAIVWK